MLVKIRCYPMHPLYGASSVYVYRMWQCGLHAVLWSHIGIRMPPSCRISQYLRTFIPISVSLWNDFPDPVFDGVGTNAFLLA